MRKQFLILLLLALVATSAIAQTVRGVDSVSITVSDLDRAVEFYSKVLRFEKVSEVEFAGEDYEHLQGVFGLRIRIARMKLGSEFIELVDYLAPEGRPIPIDSRSNDRWFQHIAIIVSDMDRAYQWLRENKVQHASNGPQVLPAWNKNAGGISAFYFKDPDGHALEILHFPPDKGNPKWHKQTDQLFLGIDHTAIVVSKTQASLKFYRDLLGFEVAGESENYGTEQEHLNNVFGARLRITSMKSQSGPSIEFLEYLAPVDGRPLPADARPNDLIAWITRLKTNEVEVAAKSLNGSALISPGIVTINDEKAGFKKGFLLRDPDGHILAITSAN